MFRAVQAAKTTRYNRLTSLYRSTLAALLTIKLPAIVPSLNRGDDDRSLHLPLQNRENNRLHTENTFGDNLPIKRKNILCIRFQNIGGFATEHNHIKDGFIRTGLTSFDFDIFGIAETNVNWRLQPEEGKLWSRTRELSLLLTKSLTKYSIKEKTHPTLVDGVGQNSEVRTVTL
jgi:hypothetical protein